MVNTLVTLAVGFKDWTWHELAFETDVEAKLIEAMDSPALLNEARRCGVHLPKAAVFVNRLSLTPIDPAGHTLIELWERVKVLRADVRDEKGAAIAIQAHAILWSRVRGMAFFTSVDELAATLDEIDDKNAGEVALRSLAAQAQIEGCTQLWVEWEVF